MEDVSRLKIRKTTLRSLLLIGGMFAFAFALVPLYNVFCDITGLNGRSESLNQAAKQVDEIEVDLSRQVRLQFLATNHRGMPWEFRPNRADIVVHPGEIHTITYYAGNPTTHFMTAQAIPSVSPGQAASYLRKLECFCFNEQTLAAGGKMDMPVRFYVHKALPTDINTLTLSYTLFDITKEGDEEKESPPQPMDPSSRNKATETSKEDSATDGSMDPTSH